MLKVGDLVKIINNADKDVDRDRFPIGTICTIIEDRSGDRMYFNPYRVESNGQAWWYKERDLELIT